MAESAPTAEDLLEHSEWLTRLARALVGDAAAGDVVQDTFEAAIAKPASRRGPLRPWLGGVARNLARMSTRGRVRRERREQAVPIGDEVPSADQLLARAQLQAKVNRLVLELHEPLRSTLLLRFFEGMSASEIARAQGIPAATVRSRLKDALDRIRASLDEDHGDRRAWAVLLMPVPFVPKASGGALLVKGVVAVLVIAVAVVAIMKLTRSDDVRPAPVAEPAPVATKPAASRSITRDLATIHDDDPKGMLRLEGQVIDDHDAPVAHALVAIDTNPPIVVETEADGAFVFDHLIRRDYRIEATIGDRYAGPARLRMSDKPEPLTLRMRTGSRVDVTVTDRATGELIPNAAVELRSALTWKATTNADGVATLTGVGTDLLPLVVHAKGYAEAAMMFHAPGAAAISLARGAALAGRVVDDHDTPIANARVVAVSAAEVFTVADPPRDGVLTAADGTFTFPTISSGTWRVTATARNFAPTTSTPITLDGVHPRSGMELRLQPGAIVRGIVKDRSGAPVAAAGVSLVVQGYLPWRTRRQTFTDEHGAFAIRELAAHPVDVVAWHDTGASAIVAVDPANTEDVVLTLDLTGAIAGTVVDAKGQPLGDAQVIAEPASYRDAWNVRGVQEAVSDQAGGFRFAGLPNEPYVVRAARPGAAEAVLWLSTGVETSPDAAPIRVVVPADGRVIGKVTLDGKPLPATLQLAHTNPVATTDGSFTLAGAAGTHTLTISGPGFVTTAKDVTIVEGKDTDLGTLEVTAGRSISGRVLDERGIPVANATVAAGALLSGGGSELYIKTESIAAKDTVTDARGQFTLSGFPPASLTVVAGTTSMRSANVQLPPGTDSVTLDLVLGATSGLEGKITRNGEPLGDTLITANPVGAMWSNFFVATGPDGAFALDALAPGDYVVYPMLGRGGKAPGDLYMRRVEVVLGKRTKVEIDVAPGPIALAITVTTDAGKPLPIGLAGTIAISFVPQTAEELRDGTHLPRDQITPMHSGMIRDGHVTIEGLRPGPQTLCAMIGDPRIASSVKLQCKPIAITSAPKQAASLVVPTAWLQ